MRAYPGLMFFTPEQHQRLKAVAALQGKSLKDYVLDRVLPWTTQEKQALSELETFLAPRITEAEQGRGTATSATQIFEETLRDKR